MQYKPLSLSGMNPIKQLVRRENREKNTGGGGAQDKYHDSAKMRCT